MSERRKKQAPKELTRTVRAALLDVVDAVESALIRERSNCARAAHAAVRAEGRTEYEANRIWHAVVNHDATPRSAGREAE